MPLRVNSEGIHEKPDRALVTGFCNDNCRGVGRVRMGRVEIFNGYWFFQRFLGGSQCGRAGAGAESNALTARCARLLTLVSNLHTRCYSPQAGQSHAGGKIHADQETDHENQAFEESQEARSDEAAIKSVMGWGTWHRTSVRWGRPSDHSLRRITAGGRSFVFR